MGDVTDPLLSRRAAVRPVAAGELGRATGVPGRHKLQRAAWSV